MALPPLPSGATKERPPLPPGATAEPTDKSIGVGEAMYTGAKTAVMEPIYGAGEFLPGEFGKGAASRAKELEQEYQRTVKQQPIATRAGYFPTTVASLLIPGGAGVKMAEGAPLLARALAGGGLAGVVGGGLTPTGKEDYSERLAEKGKGAALGGALGTALGASAPLVPAAGKAITAIKKGYQDVTGKTAAKAAQEAEALGTKVKGKTSELVQERVGAEKQAQMEAEKSAKELQSPKNRELQAQKDITQASSAVSQKLIADKTRTAKEASDSLSKLSNRALPEGKAEEELGGLIQPLGKSNVKALSETRQKSAITETKDPAFERARAKESKGQFIITDKKSAPLLESAFADLETQINRTTEPYQSQLKARLQSLKGKEIPLSEGELRVERLKEASIPGYSAKTTKQEPLTLDNAEFMRRMLTDKDLAEATGFAALDIARRGDVAKKLSAAMKEFEPGVGEYLSKYQETSAPITKALAGRGEKLIEAEKLAEQEVLYSADKSAVAKYYLDGSKERASRLLDLVGGKPKELVDSVAGLVRARMENMSANQAKQFLDQGLFDVFPELKSGATAVAKSKEAAEKAASLVQKQGVIGATGPTGRLAQALGSQSSLEKKLAQSAGEAATTAKKAEDSAIKFETFNTHLGTLSGEDSLLQSKNFLRKMAEDNRIPQDAYQKSLQEIQQAEAAFQKFKDADTLKKNLRRALTYKVLATTVGGGTAYYFTH